MAEEDKQNLLKSFSEALAHIKELKGMLPDSVPTVKKSAMT